MMARELLKATRHAAHLAEEVVPCDPGFYAIFVDDPGLLGKPYSTVLRAQQTDLIYVGIATRSLRDRLVDQDLRHKRRSTFFRGLGAILGFRPPGGSLIGKKNRNNYTFSPGDTRSIIVWVDKHLSVSWVKASPADPKDEEGAIRSLQPVLNRTYNPSKLPELDRLRRECRLIALSHD